MTDNTDKVLSERFLKFFEGLDPVESRQLFEELIDDYCYGTYGMPIMEEIKKVKREQNATCVSIQSIADKGILISAYGFRTLHQAPHPEGGVRVILKEVTLAEHRKDARNRG